MVKFSDLKKEFNLGYDGISDDTMLEFHSSVSRKAGTGYRDYIYSIDGNKNDAIIIHMNRVDHGTLYNSCEYEKNFFNKQQDYAKQVGALSKKYNIPFEVSLALGTKEEVYKALSDILPSLKSNNSVSDIEYITYELSCGINRRKNAIEGLIGEDLSHKISLNYMGQANSTRIAYYLRDILEGKTVYKTPDAKNDKNIEENRPSKNKAIQVTAEMIEAEEAKKAPIVGFDLPDEIPTDMKNDEGFVKAVIGEDDDHDTI